MHHFDQFLLTVSEGKIPPLDNDFKNQILEETKRICQNDSSLFEKTAPLVAAKLLLEKGADINVRDPENQETPIMKSIYSNNSDLFSFFLSRGAKLDLVGEFDQTLLHMACSVGNSNIVERLLETQQISVSQKAKNQEIALHYSIHHPNIVNALLKLDGSLVNAQDAEGNTALHLAVQNSAPIETIRILIHFHADFTIQNNDGQTPRSLARALNAYDIDLFLMEQEFLLNEKALSLREQDQQNLALIQKDKTDCFNIIYSDIYATLIHHKDYDELAKKELNIQSGKKMKPS